MEILFRINIKILPVRLEGEYFYVDSIILLKRPVSDTVGDHYKDERADDEAQIDFPAELDPGAVVHPAHGKLYQ